MRKVKFSIKYVIICWVIIYLIISIFKFVEIKQKIYQKYGAIADKFRTTFYYNDSLVIDCGLIIVSLPAVLLVGGPSGLNFSINNINIDKNDLFKTNISLRSEFLEKEFNIVMQHGEIIQDNFYDVLSTDSKFQHLYSDYIKEQIGLDDENIEFEFKGAVKFGQQVGEKPKIDFSEINANEDINEQICKNLKNLYLTRVYVNNCTMNQKEEILNYAIELEKKLKKYVFADGEKSLYIQIKLLNDENIYKYKIFYDYNNNTRKYSIYDKNYNSTDWQTF